MIKSLIKPGVVGTFLNRINSIYEKHTAKSYSMVKDRELST